MRERESRIQPAHLDMIIGRLVRAGMRVAPIDPPRPRAVFREVRRVQPLQLQQARLTFEDKTRLVVSAHAFLLRELTSSELDHVDALMSAYLDRGAVHTRRMLPRGKSNTS